jgi:PTH2 family peptidyl-tRNA hydrolase
LGKFWVRHKSIKSFVTTLIIICPFRQTKIAVKVPKELEFVELISKAKALGIVYYLVRDAGRTQIAAGSKTVLALGPAPKDILDKITGHLKLL